MPSFEPTYYKTVLSSLEEERENATYSKSHFEEHWESLRVQWNDAAGRNVDNRNMTPLIDVYAQLLTQSQQHLEVKKTCSNLFESLQQLLIDAAHHHESFTQLMGDLAIQSEERDRTLRSSETLSKQVEEQQEEIAVQKQSANSHVKPI